MEVYYQIRNQYGYGAFFKDFDKEELKNGLSSVKIMAFTMLIM